MVVIVIMIPTQAPQILKIWLDQLKVKSFQCFHNSACIPLMLTTEKLKKKKHGKDPNSCVSTRLPCSVRICLDSFRREGGREGGGREGALCARNMDVVDR